MKHIAIIVNGELETSAELKARIEECNIIVAVNGGMNHCLSLEIEPDLVLGDMDSASTAAKKKFERTRPVVYPMDKDQTDLEIAVEYCMEQHPSSITIFGALGQRIDHTLCNLYLLTRFPKILFIETSLERIFALGKGITKFTVAAGKTISLLPIAGGAKGLHTKGLKWKLQNMDFPPNATIGISNVAIDPQIEIEISEGFLLCIINKF